MVSKFLVLTAIPLILSMGLVPILSFADSIQSPRHQMSDGVSAQDVICKGGYTLMIRISGDAACVTPSTASKLNTAGWGEIIKEFEIEVEPQDEEVSLDEEVSMADEEPSNGEEESEEGQTTEVNLNDGAGTSDSG
ncbi:MAG: hypothetical protein ACE5RJ_05455 [Nitrosopumilaceae archaeon]